MLRSKAFTIVTHLLGWFLFCTVPILFWGGQSDTENITAALSSPPYWLFVLSFIFIFYLNAYLLIPKLYLSKKYVTYAAVLLLLLTGIYFLKPFDRLLKHHQPPTSGFVANQDVGERPPEFRFNRRPPPPPRSGAVQVDVVSIFLFGIMVALSMATEITRQWRESEKRVIRAEADKANAELSFLKAQINPHFLFNTLNNVYSLAITKSEHTAASIMKLSNIMRYVTDDATQNLVPLEDEVDCIRDYIDLQKLRLGKKAEVNFSVIGSLDAKQIAPLVMMTFIENVFKYGISNHEPAPISIQITAESQNIRFFCQNKIFTTHHAAGSTGIGLANTRQRLEHLYPNKHTLLISSENGVYTVQLTLQV